MSQEFAINHYAGDVKYTVEGFLEKNKNLLFYNLKEVSKMVTSIHLLDFLNDYRFMLKANAFEQ